LLFLKILLISAAHLVNLSFSSNRDTTVVTNIPINFDNNTDSAGIGSYPLSWTASGDDGYEGTASQYDIRISTIPITPDNFYQATKVPNAPLPKLAGTKEHFMLTLQSGEYYVAAKVADEVPNWSTLSNVPKLKIGVYPPIGLSWEK